MSTIGTLSLVHSCDCKACGWTAEGDTKKQMYLLMLIHLRFVCRKTKNRPSFLKALWQLWRWKP